MAIDYSPLPEMTCIITSIGEAEIEVEEAEEMEAEAEAEEEMKCSTYPMSSPKCATNNCIQQPCPRRSPRPIQPKQGWPHGYARRWDLVHLSHPIRQDGCPLLTNQQFERLHCLRPTISSPRCVCYYSYEMRRVGNVIGLLGAAPNDYCTMRARMLSLAHLCHWLTERSDDGKSRRSKQSSSSSFSCTKTLLLFPEQPFAGWDTNYIPTLHSITTTPNKALSFLRFPKL